MDFCINYGCKICCSSSSVNVRFKSGSGGSKDRGFRFYCTFNYRFNLDRHCILNGLLKSLKLGPLNRLAGGAFGSLKGLLVVLITMQGVGPWVESSPHWKQSKFIQFLLPYAPLATELSKDAASEAFHQITSGGGVTRTSPKPMDESEETELRPDHSTKNPFY